jgi:sugar-specific transcriptional regulator TrmB
MILEKSLEKFGLTIKEAKVYLAVLELGQDTILNIAKKAELKRPTVYVTIEELIEKGLVQKLPKGTTTLYAAENPDYLLNILHDREQSIKNILPLLKAIYNVEKNKPQIKFYEGKEGVKKIYKDIYKTKKYIYFYGSVKDIKKHFPESFLNPEQIKKLNVPVYELVSSHPVDIKYAKEIKKVRNPNHKIKSLKRGITFIVDSLVYDNKVAIVSLKGTFFGVVIESKDIAYSFKLLYDLAFQSAEPIK